jgi:hypothetical protein
MIIRRLRTRRLSSRLYSDGVGVRISEVEPQQEAAVRLSPKPGAIGRCDMRKILSAIALATLLATPAFAATRHHQLAHSPSQVLQASPPIFMYAPDPPSVSDPARDAALQNCNALAGKISNQSWQTAQFAAYGACMSEHGQQP